MAYTIFDPNANVTRLVRVGARTPKPALIDTTFIPAANASQGSPVNILINAGDICFVTVNNAVASLNTPGASKANTATHCGIAETGYPLRQAQGVYVGSIDPITDPPEVTLRQDGQFLMRATPGEQYVLGQAVYLGIDAQTITNVSTGNGTQLGTVVSDQRRLVGRPELGQTITGAASTTLPQTAVLGGEIIIDYLAAVRF